MLTSFCVLLLCVLALPSQALEQHHSREGKISEQANVKYFGLLVVESQVTLI